MGKDWKDQENINLGINLGREDEQTNLRHNKLLGPVQIGQPIMISSFGKS